VPLAMIQKLARYWMTDYDWRACEANLNALPQFITEIDGLPGDRPLPARLRAATLDAHGPAWTPSAQVQPRLPADPGTKPAGLRAEVLALHLFRRIAGVPATGAGGDREGGLNDCRDGFPKVGVGGYHHRDRPREDTEEDLKAR
jgi:hypothetical protein